MDARQNGSFRKLYEMDDLLDRVAFTRHVSWKKPSD
jgi:hypothetical protein